MVYNESSNDVPQRVQQTVADATNLSNGADSAAAQLQNDVFQNYQQLGGGREYGNYLRQVTDSLKSNPAFEEVAVAWTNHNVQRFDMDGNGSLDQGEINAAIHRSQDPLERQILVDVRDQYQSIKHAGGDGFLGIRNDALEPEDFSGFVGDKQATRNQVLFQKREQEQSRFLMQPLLSTGDGNPDRSLFSVLDNVTGGNKDGNISRSDLNSFVAQYDRAVLNGGDVNQGAFTRTNRDYAHNLAQNWDTPEVVALRGQHIEQTGHQTRKAGNAYITEQSLLAASGYSQGESLFRKFQTPAPQTKIEASATIKPMPQPGDQLLDPYGPTTKQLAHARAQFQRQLEQHIKEENHYVVKPGQGFDRIARDVIKSHSADGSYKKEHKSEKYIEQWADKIAKLNGRAGRLADRPVLQPGEDLKLFDDAWVKKQIRQSMRLFDKTVQSQ